MKMYIIKLYFENRDINSSIEEFKLFTLNFLEIFLILNFLVVFCSCGQTTPVISFEPNGAFLQFPATPAHDNDAG